MSKIIMISSSATNVILRYTDDTSHNLRKKIKYGKINFALKMTFTSTVVVVGCTLSSGKVFTSFTDRTSFEDSKISTHPLLEYK